MWITDQLFLSAVWTHSDGTHSLQRVHWCASAAMLNFSKSFKKKHPYILDGLKVSTLSANTIFWMNYSFKVMFPGSVTRAIREKREVRAVHLFILDCHT